MDKNVKLAELTANVVSAYVAHNDIGPEKLPGLISQVHAALGNIVAGNEQSDMTARGPAVPLDQSVSNDHIICLEDGLAFQSLKRHLRAHHDMSPAQYREKWGLSADYPMVAPSYSKKRSQLARKSGLGKVARKG